MVPKLVFFNEYFCKDPFVSLNDSIVTMELKNN